MILRRAVWIAAACVLANVAAAQTITDGDTVKLNGTTYRLWGIDAPELKQVCPDGWPAGRRASTHLQSLMVGRKVICEWRDTDRYGRTVALCRAGGRGFRRDHGAGWLRLGVRAIQHGLRRLGSAGEGGPSGRTSTRLHAGMGVAGGTTAVGVAMFRQFGRAIAFGAAATMAVLALSPITKSGAIALSQVSWALCVGILVAVGVALSG